MVILRTRAWRRKNKIAKDLKNFPQKVERPKTEYRREKLDKRNLKLEEDTEDV